MRIEQVQWASAQIDILNSRLEPALDPQAEFACPLSPLYSHSARRRMERNGGVIIEMLLSMPQTS